MSGGASRPLRADAARNSEKILRAAREVFAEQGPDAPLDDIARRAGVGIATLYRRFPHKAALVRAALDLSFTEELAPAIERALADDDPRRGLMDAVESAVAHTARNYNTLAAARDVGALTAEAGERFFETLAPLLRRGQQQGVVRADLVVDDLRRIMQMLVSVLWTMDPREGGWHRYTVLIFDALAPEAASPLPPAAPMRRRTPGA
ncbi:TetR family transcriptional regulator [Actinomadura sp. CNU-125]|uniref:TetR/AcrR family transcriptional regulator n=1 Tax=Actinomadura sp. CNU-125 TaxID=1904961 RepID=UPI000965A49B|nr:TetR/AcrR family transcriptional regulator [Actinomadura sp. CNU-125]OLT27188.1 TetR family transcriptional regulator [Actinomadura sp. CNU-125]